MKTPLIQAIRSIAILSAASFVGTGCTSSASHRYENNCSKKCAATQPADKLGRPPRISKQAETKPTTQPATQPSSQPATARRSISLTLEAPSPIWSLEFEKAKLIDGELWVLWRLAVEPGMMAAAVITPCTAIATLPVPSDVPVRHLVIGKTYNWQDPKVEVIYIDSEQDLGDTWEAEKTIE